MTDRDAVARVRERFERVATGFSARVDQVPSAGWELPAPCAGWVARDVVAHLVGWIPAVLGRSGLSFEVSAAVADDPAAAWLELRARIDAALADPATATREFDAGPPGRMTIADAVDRLVTGDVLVHTWDLARATGLDERIDADVAADMLAGMEPIDAMLRASGHFGPRVAVPDDADVQTRLLAFTGRHVRG
jgi:uncharacterized protein (TIGR03086 family)